MRVLFVHPHFPGHFALLAHQLATQRGWDCTYLSSCSADGYSVPYPVVTYRVGADPTYRHPSTFEENRAHMSAILQAAKSLKKPDLVVGHLCSGTLLFLKTVFDCPFLGYFDYLPPPFWSDEFVLRPDYPPNEANRLGNAVNHAFTWLQLPVVDAIYTPTRFQLSLLPAEYRHKARVVFDCALLDLGVARPAPRPAELLGHRIEPQTRVVTYVSRGLEAMRGFDIFMQVARRIYRQRPDVKFFIAGEAASTYGYEMQSVRAASFKEHVLAGGDYDPSKFAFLGRIPGTELARLLALSDVHFHLTAPYVLSWSCLNAMAAGCVIVGSATPPVQEVIEDGVHGLLAGFYDVEGLAARALAVLADPASHRHLGAAAARRIRENYGVQKSVDDFVALANTLTGQRASG